MIEKCSNNGKLSLINGQVLIDGKQFSYLGATVMVESVADKWALFDILADAAINGEPNTKVALKQLMDKL